MSFSSYEWSQTADEILISTKQPKLITKSDVFIEISNNKIICKISNLNVISGCLQYKIKPEKLVWTIEEHNETHNIINIHLEKYANENWDILINEDLDCLQNEELSVDIKSVYEIGLFRCLKGDLTGLEFIKKSATLLYVPAILCLANWNNSGTYMDVDLKSSFDYFLKAAELKSPEACYTVAMSFTSKTENHDIDYKTSVEYLLKGLEISIDSLDVERFCYQLGLLYKEDFNLAIKYWTISSKLGNSDSIYNLGIFYLDGIGFEPNIFSGVRMLQLALLINQELPVPDFLNGMNQRQLEYLIELSEDNPMDETDNHKNYLRNLIKIANIYSKDENKYNKMVTMGSDDFSKLFGDILNGKSGEICLKNSYIKTGTYLSSQNILKMDSENILTLSKDILNEKADINLEKNVLDVEKNLHILKSNEPNLALENSLIIEDVIEQEPKNDIVVDDNVFLILDQNNVETLPEMESNRLQNENCDKTDGLNMIKKETIISQLLKETVPIQSLSDIVDDTNNNSILKSNESNLASENALINQDEIEQVETKNDTVMDNNVIEIVDQNNVETLTEMESNLLQNENCDKTDELNKIKNKPNKQTVSNQCLSDIVDNANDNIILKSNESILVLENTSVIKHAIENVIVVDNSVFSSLDQKNAENLPKIEPTHFQNNNLDIKNKRNTINSETDLNHLQEKETITIQGARDIVDDVIAKTISKSNESNLASKNALINQDEIEQVETKNDTVMDNNVIAIFDQNNVETLTEMESNLLQTENCDKTDEVNTIKNETVINQLHNKETVEIQCLSDIIDNANNNSILKSNESILVLENTLVIEHAIEKVEPANDIVAYNSVFSSLDQNSVETLHGVDSKQLQENNLNVKNEIDLNQMKNKETILIHGVSDIVEDVNNNNILNLSKSNESTLALENAFILEDTFEKLKPKNDIVVDNNVIEILDKNDIQFLPIIETSHQLQNENLDIKNDTNIFKNYTDINQLYKPNEEMNTLKGIIVDDENIKTILKIKESNLDFENAFIIEDTIKQVKQTNDIVMYNNVLPIFDKNNKKSIEIDSNQILNKNLDAEKEKITIKHDQNKYLNNKTIQKCVNADNAYNISNLEGNDSTIDLDNTLIFEDAVEEQNEEKDYITDTYLEHNVIDKNNKESNQLQNKNLDLKNENEINISQNIELTLKNTSENTNGVNIGEEVGFSHLSDNTTRSKGIKLREISLVLGVSLVLTFCIYKIISKK